LVLWHRWEAWEIVVVVVVLWDGRKVRKPVVVPSVVVVPFVVVVLWDRRKVRESVVVSSVVVVLWDRWEVRKAIICGWSMITREIILWRCRWEHLEISSHIIIRWRREVGKMIRILRRQRKTRKRRLLIIHVFVVLWDRWEIEIW